MKIASAWIVVLVSLGLLFLPPNVTMGQGVEDSAPVDIVIVLDDSGSMADCINPWTPNNEKCTGSQIPPSDPRDLRYSAARLLATLADSDDRVAVVRFASRVEGVGALGNLTPMGGPENRERLISSLKAPQDYSANGETRIDLGFAKAAEIFAGQQASARARYLLFLTDGVPYGGQDQGPSVRNSAAALRRMGVQTFAVVLCNETAGCPEGAATFLESNANVQARTAQNASELLREFSDIFASIKPELHVVDRRNRDGNLEFFTRETQAVRRIAVVASAGEMNSLRRDGKSTTTEKTLDDGNIEVDMIESSALPAGRWVGVTQDQGAFAVANTDTYPTLLSPPSSIAESPTSVRYAPSGKPLLLVGGIHGPAGEDPLLLDGTAPLQPLTADGQVRWITAPPGRKEIMLQVGSDTAPLQIVKHFSIEMRSDLPKLQADSPSATAGCVPNNSCPFQMSFGPGPEVTELRGRAYVLDHSLNDQPVYDADMACQGRVCSYEGFIPEDGHSYTIFFVAEGVSQDVRFGDWAEANLVMEPAVYVRGLPDPLNLDQQPPDGWPVTVIAGTTEDLGRLTADLSLKRTDDGSSLSGVKVVFGVDLRGAGEQKATLKVDLPPDMAPGQYEGELSFKTERQPTGVRFPPPVKVFRNVATPTAVIEGKDVNFGKMTFDINGQPVMVEADLPIRFTNGDPFVVQVTEFTSANCSGLQLAVDAPKGGKLPLRLFTTGQTWLQPGICTGTFALAAPDANSAVKQGANLTWTLEVVPLTWAFRSVRGADGRQGQDFRAGDIGLPQERARGELLVYFTGNPDFHLEVSDLRANGGRTSIGAESLELLLGEPKPADEASDYLVPIDLVVKESILHHPVWGTTYSGNFKLAVAGLPGKPATVSFRFRSPSWLQRHIFKYYHWLWPGIVCWPLSVLFLLAATFVTLRRRAIRLEDQVAVQPADPSPPPIPPPPIPPPPPPSQRPGPSTPSLFGTGSSPFATSYGPTRYEPPFARSSSSTNYSSAPFSNRPSSTPFGSSTQATGRASTFSSTSLSAASSSTAFSGMRSQPSPPSPGSASASSKPVTGIQQQSKQGSKPPWL